MKTLPTSTTGQAPAGKMAMGFRKSILLIGTILGAGLASQVEAQSATPFTTVYRYDAARRLTATIEPDPDGTGPLHYAATRMTYDNAGRLTRVEKGELASLETGSPENWTTFTVLQQVDTEYDALDRKVAERVSGLGTGETGALPLKTLTQTSYDLAGRVDCTTVRMTPTWSALPGACTLTATGSNGPDRITHNVYDAAGQLLKVQRAYQITTANGFPATLQQDYVTYQYNGTGKQTSVTDANGNRAELVYDAQDRQQMWIFPSPTTPGVANAPTSTNPGDYELYTYDPNGNRLTLRKRDGTTIQYSYDALNRLYLKSVPTSATGASGYSVYQGYDNRGLLLYARFGSATGQGLTNDYDNVGRLHSSTTNMDGTNRTMAYQYDADGNRKMLFGDLGYTLGYDYDGLDRLTGLHEGSATGNQIAFIDYDQLGRRKSLGQGSGAPYSLTSYGYDGASRLQTQTHDLVTSVAGNDQVLTFGYNPASQIVSRARTNSSWEFTEQVLGTKAYATNGLNQYLSAGSNSFLYDANGNLSFDGTRTYKYDAENRLVSVTGDITSTLSYDPLGRLWRFTGPQSGDVRFLYDGDRMTQEYDGNGAQIRSYVHGLGADEPLLWYELGGGFQRRFLHADHQGSIVGLTDDTGNTFQIDKYDEWGVPAAGNWGRFEYTGQMWLGDLGLYYYKARMYSSRLGRFLQTDPIGYKDQVNLYAYVGNDPVDGRDPTGMYRPGDEFSSPEAAAADAITFINPTSIKQNAEYGGRIEEKRPGVFIATQPKTNGSGLNVTLPAMTSKTRGDYHTHGDYSTLGPKGQLVRTTKEHDLTDADHFGREDKQGIDLSATIRPGYKGYLGTPSGKILQYDPSKKKESPLPPPSSGPKPCLRTMGLPPAC